MIGLVLLEEMAEHWEAVSKIWLEQGQNTSGFSHISLV